MKIIKEISGIMLCRLEFWAISEASMRSFHVPFILVNLTLREKHLQLNKIEKKLIHNVENCLIQ